MSKVGFIGLGMMGTPMAHRLHAAAYEMVVKDANVEIQSVFVNTHPDSVGAAGGADFAGCDVIVTMLPNSDIVDAVARDLEPHLAPGTCVIEMSSADPSRTRDLAVRLADKGIALIDAPVSGGVKKAIAGTLAIMVGGAVEEFEKQRSLLEVIGKAITYVGPVGSGHALKALNNYVSAAALIATAEAIHVGVAFGIDAAVIVDVINASTGKNNTTENKAHQFMLNGAFNSGFSLVLQAKDVGIAASLGRTMGLPMSLAQDVSVLTFEASKSLGATADHTELYRFAGRR